MQFIDLQAQYAQHKSAIDAAIARVLAHGQYLFGPEITTLENTLADYVGVKHCIAMSSGTTALQIALMALDIRAGDEIITSPFSFFAAAEVSFLLGITPKYVDIDPNTYLLDPAQLSAAITEKTKAIIPVSLYGQCADMDAINAIAKAHHIAVIEDAAQSFGAKYKNIFSCGPMSAIACTSFFPSKPLGAYGDGGACFTEDDTLAHRLRLLINHGQETRYHHTMIGINGRMDTLQAAILLEKFKYLDEELAVRQTIARYYRDALPKTVKIPTVAPYNYSVYAQYTIEVDDRARVQKTLSDAHIPTAVHYPIGLHAQPIIAQLSDEKLSFPVTDRAAARVLSLPFHPYLTQSMVEAVCCAVEEAL